MRNKIFNKKNRKSSGFTLIEILMVIAIIALISSIAMYALNRARQRGRDTKRIADLKQIDTAIQLYTNENGHAPYLGALNCQVSNPYNCVATDTDWTYLQADLLPYIKKLPIDPCGLRCADGSNNWFTYIYASPAYQSNYCQAISCDWTEDTLNKSYAIFAENMELQPAPYVFNHGLGASY